MSWLFPLSKSASSSAAGSPGGLTSLQQQKQRLIESLRNSHSSIAEIQKDVEYRLPFTINNLTININILLPPQFPQEKPVISVYPPIRHHLMDKQGVYVTSPLVNNFTMHSDLGKIIQSLLDEFWKNPPVLAPTSTAFPYLYSNPSGMPPYASQGFPFLPPYPPQEANRSITSLSVADTVSSSTTSYTTAKPAAPSFGVLSNLPLPIPTMDASIPTSQNGFGYKMPDVPDAFPELSELRSLDNCEHFPTVVIFKERRYINISIGPEFTFTDSVENILQTALCSIVIDVLYDFKVKIGSLRCICKNYLEPYQLNKAEKL
uniref:VPS37 C-terminal domain-containing protein n=1 Tax=Colobus angolensis palliatus TaxID=336983 RepID=A0A2K5IQ69_COLAP